MKYCSTKRELIGTMSTTEWLPAIVFPDGHVRMGPPSYNAEEAENWLLGVAEALEGGQHGSLLYRVVFAECYRVHVAERGVIEPAPPR